MSLLRAPRALVLGLLAMISVAACAGIYTPEGSGYKTAIKFEPADDGGTLPAVQPDEVKMLSAKDPPKGVAFRGPQHPRLAHDYPSPDRPHKRVGTFEVQESADHVIDFDGPAFVARREDAVRRAAAAKGANAVFSEVRTDSGDPSPTMFYEAYRLSDAEPVYPSTEEVLAALHLEPEGFKVAHRFTLQLSELGARKPEPITLKTGHAYALAIALHPGPVDVRLDDRQSLGFVLKVDRDAVFPEDRRGAFNRRLDKDYGDPLVVHAAVDGVFARGGMGFIGGNGLGLRIELVTRTATIEIARIDGFKGPIPAGELGPGEADCVVYERKVSPEDLRKAACDHCRTTAAACSKRHPLEACDELKKCFQLIEKPLNACVADYE